MTISRIDLLNQRFSRSIRGYSVEEVDRTMQEVADAIGQLSEQNAQLESRVTDLGKRLTDYRSREETLRETLMTAQRIADDMKANAQREAQLIIDAAHSKAETLINQGHQRLARIHSEISEAKKVRMQFEMKVEAVINAHASLLETSRKEDKALDALEQKVTYLQTKSG